MRLDSKFPAFSYKSDPDVPEIAWDGPIAFMDGDCALCSVGARLIARFDRKCEFRICTVQSELGQAVLRHYGLDLDDPATWLYLENGEAFTSMDAMMKVGRRVGGVGWLLQPFWLVPRGVRDWLYRRLALNRYAMFGRRDMCSIPDQRLKDRLL